MMRSKGLIPALAAAALSFAVQSRADGLIPEGAPNIATTVADAVFRCTPRLPDVAFAIM